MADTAFQADVSTVIIVVITHVIYPANKRKTIPSEVPRKTIIPNGLYLH